MGNNQSSTHHNRLSKPKTNTNSPSPIAKVDSPVSVTSRYADLSTEGRQQIKETLLSPVDSDFGSTTWASKGDGVVEQVALARGRTASIVSRANSRTNSRSNSMSCFGSKHGSATKLGGFADSKISLVSTGQMDLETAIKMLQEVKKIASPEDLAALHEVLDSADESAVPIAEQGLSQNTSVANSSSSSLTRRRSLIQTPGVATRNSPVEGRRRTWNSWKAPQLKPEEEVKWRAAPKKPFSTTHLTALDLAEEGRKTPTPRAQTPGEMDYSHLGSLKLGTLMVTNGAPSPAPSTKPSKQKPLSTEEEDYFSSIETGSSPLMMKTTKRRGHARSKSAAAPATLPFYDSDVPMPSLKPRNVHGQTITASQPAAAPPATQPKQQLKTTVPSLIAPTQHANHFAQSYQSELPMSPFTGAHGDRKDGQNSGIVCEDDAPYRKEAARIFEGTMFELDASGESTASALTAAIPCERTAETPKPKDRRPLPRTTDSGYSSGGSLLTANREQRNSGLSTLSGRRSHSSQEREDMQEVSTAKSSPAEVHVPSISYEQTQSPTTHTAQAHRRPAALKMFEQSSRSSTRSSGSEATLSPQTPRSVASQASFNSTSSTQKRLQRRRPSQPDLPVVQSCQPIPEGTIPEVPSNVRSKFTRRLSNTPGMECLTNTYPSKDHELFAEPPPDASTSGLAVFQQLTELEPVRPPTPPIQGRKRSLSLFRRRSYAEPQVAEKKDEGASLDVLDLGTIATSLGTSPYDAAMSSPARKSIHTPTHPHQLGNSLPRAKSMVSMDSQTAAEFARMRSKDRALAESEAPQRRRSYHNLKQEAGEAKAAKRRPQSYAHDIPPVPVIDASKHKAPLIATTRPQSEGQRKPQSDLSFGIQSRERGQAVSQLVDKYDYSGQALSQQSRDGINWEEHSRSWSQRRQTLGEGLRTKPGMAEASASTINSRNASRCPQDVESWGRFSGGLQYNYQGGGVIAGSAGTQSVHKLASSKSMQWKIQHGVDLSDVPIMLQRA